MFRFLLLYLTTKVRNKRDLHPILSQKGQNQTDKTKRMWLDQLYVTNDDAVHSGNKPTCYDTISTLYCVLMMPKAMIETSSYFPFVSLGLSSLYFSFISDDLFDLFNPKILCVGNCRCGLPNIDECLIAPFAIKRSQMNVFKDELY